MSSRAQVCCLALSLVALTATVFARTAQNGFLYYDDDAYVTQNGVVQEGLTPHSLRWAFQTRHAANWHPLTWLSHMLDVDCFGLNPRGHHLVNVAWHSASAVLFFSWLMRTTRALGPAWLAAALFAIHPLRCESVAWIAERKDVLSLFFGLCCLLAYTAYVQRGGAWRYLLALGALALGLLCKPTLVTLPGVLLLVDGWPLGRWPSITYSQEYARRTSWRRLLAEKIGFVVLAVVSSVITLRAQRNAGAVSSLEIVPLAYRLQTVAIAYVSYLGDFVWPRDLRVIYPQMMEPWPMGTWSAAVMLLVVVTVAAVLAFRRWPYVLVGWLWYLGTLIPMSGIITFGGHWKANRYTYLPGLGLSLIAAWGATELASRWRLPVWTRRLVSGAVVAALAVTTWIQLADWHDTESLMNRAIALDADNFLAYSCRGYAEELAGRLPDAIASYRTALAIRPGYPECQSLLAAALVRSGNTAEAETHARLAVSMKPRLSAAQSALGATLVAQGRLREALPHLEQAAELLPEFARYECDVAAAYVRLEEWSAAEQHASRAIANSPQDPHGYRMRALVRLHSDRLPAARLDAQQAVRLGPQYAETWKTLGMVSARLGDAAAAVEQLSRAATLARNDAETCFELGQTLQVLHRPQDAETYYRQALKIDGKLALVQNNLAWILATTRTHDRAALDEARALAQSANQQTAERHPEFLDTLALVHEACGEFPAAIQRTEQALGLAERAGKTKLADQLRERLASLRGRAPQDGEG